MNIAVSIGKALNVLPWAISRQGAFMKVEQWGERKFTSTTLEAVFDLALTSLSETCQQAKLLVSIADASSIMSELPKEWSYEKRLRFALFDLAWNSNPAEACCAVRVHDKMFSCTLPSGLKFAWCLEEVVNMGHCVCMMHVTHPKGYFPPFSSLHRSLEEHGWSIREMTIHQGNDC